MIHVFIVTVEGDFKPYFYNVHSEKKPNKHGHEQDEWADPAP